MGRCYCTHRREGKELVLLAVVFWVFLFIFGNNPAYCVKNPNQNQKMTSHKKNQTLPYPYLKLQTLQHNEYQQLNEHKAQLFSRRGRVFKHNIRDKISVGIWHLKVPWNSGIISHTTEVTHHSPEKSLHWFLRHHTPKRKSKPNLNFYQFSFMIW